MLGTTLAQGVLAGVLATSMMSLPEYLAWRRWDLVAVFEWHENQTVMGRLLRRPPNEVLLPGLLLHLAHGGAAGAVFFLGAKAWNLGSLIAPLGSLYGILLWAITLVIHGPITGVSPFNSTRGPWPALLSLGGHLLYGTVLGLLGWYV